MNKAFIFDFDGVLINNEPMWEVEKREMYERLFGEEVFLRMGNTLGVSMDGIHERAVESGATIEKELFVKEFNKKADLIYKKAPLTLGIDSIGKEIVALGYKIGIVSASPMAWLEASFERTSLKDNITYILSLYDREEIPHKPAPDGYFEAMRILGSSPETTVILEDSNSGIASAMASGAFTIGFRQNLIPGYIQLEANAYADSLDDVVEILKNRDIKI